MKKNFDDPQTSIRGRTGDLCRRRSPSGGQGKWQTPLYDGGRGETTNDVERVQGEFGNAAARQGEAESAAAQQGTEQGSATARRQHQVSAAVWRQHQGSAAASRVCRSSAAGLEGSGLCAVSSHAARQYHVISELKTMTEAQSYCREKYTDLASIHNMEDVNTLNNVVKHGKYRAWIGLYDESWRWSLSNSSFYKPGETEFRSWFSVKPRGYSPSCASMRPRPVHWQPYACNKKLNPVCMDVTGTDVTFSYIDNLMTWTEAQSYCREHHTDLASMRNKKDNKKVHEQKPFLTPVWIGLFRDTWKWSDGSDFSFTHWTQSVENNSKPLSESCVVANFAFSGEWEDESCETKNSFICYKAVSKQEIKVIKMRFVKKDSSLDLNDPAVQENMLQQMKKKLKDQGLDDNIKLSWRKQADGKVFHKEEKVKDEL
ncbi:macrophage mannose receptor 1-like [Cottoperca gobio]|uniref:Macrophage mannose receptor 1-like n=1 Tax=Cottoperca gobio TaxID=56716 RepID=A0A6J2QMS8_COTGO|nr:macrophage mannose receptor 1-like [Cottoperca gobio]